MTAITPNTFQCFNAYVDKAMELLTDSELRVLIYATRHIMGWQDKIAKRQGYISLTMFEKGYSNNEGTIHYGGCGLSRAAIIKACTKLTEFKLLKKVGLPTEDGQKWELTTDDIQWKLMEDRANQKTSKQKGQTVKATAASLVKRGVTSDIPVTSDVIMQGTSNVTMQGNVGRTQTKPSSKPSSKPVGRKTHRDWSMEDAIISAWVDATDRFGSFNTNYRREQASDLLAINCTPELVAEIVKWKRPNGNLVSYEFGYLAEDLPEYLVIKARQTKEAERAAAAKAKMEETMRINSAMMEQAGVKHAS